MSSELSVVSNKNSPFTTHHSHSSVQECDATGDAILTNAHQQKILLQKIISIIYSMKNCFLLLIVLPLFVFGQQHADILILHGKIIDGAGNPWFYGDVAVRQGKIVAIGDLSKWQATKTIDATGLIVAPGFIDVHTHIEG